MTFDVILNENYLIFMFSVSKFRINTKYDKGTLGYFLCFLNNIRYSNVSSYKVDMVYYYMIHFREILQPGIFWPKPYLAL